MFEELNKNHKIQGDLEGKGGLDAEVSKNHIMKGEMEVILSHR